MNFLSTMYDLLYSVFRILNSAIRQQNLRLTNLQDDDDYELIIFNE